jgi:hypothetical protein
MSNKNHSSSLVYPNNGNPNNGNPNNGNPNNNGSFLNLTGLKYPLFHQMNNNSTSISNSNENSIEDSVNKVITQQPIQPIQTIHKKHIQQTQNIQQNQVNQPIQQIQQIQQIPENLFHLMELLTNLKLLSHLKQHDKLTCDNKNDVVEIDSRYYLQGIRRWICGDTRTETINFIDKLVVSAEYLSENLILSKNIDDKHNLKILTEDLISSKNGLNNLKITYFDDKLFVSRIENYLEKIKLRIDKNNKSI